MPAPNDSDRRFTLALTAAVAATTVAVGVTAATLLGWIRTSEPDPTATAAPTETAAPAASAPTTPAVVYVPIAPVSPPTVPVVAQEEPRGDQLALEDERREHERHEHDREDDDE